MDNILSYQTKQGVEQYYTLFKVMIHKYSLDEDYSNYIWGEIDEFSLQSKWDSYAIMFVKFFAYASDNVLVKLLSREDFVSYFLRYSKVYKHDVLEGFGEIGFGYFLVYDSVASHYVKDTNKLFSLLKNNIKINVPQSIMQHPDVVRQIARQYDVENFHFQLSYIKNHTITIPYIEEHIKYCDEQIANSINDILPCFMNIYDSADDLMTKQSARELFGYYCSGFILSTIERIFQINHLDKMSKTHFFQELSKYISFNFLVSINYATSPYNLLIDIKTLYEFANEKDKFIKGYDIYKFLVNYESKSIDEIVAFYQKTQNLPLMEILYDDLEEKLLLKKLIVIS